MHYTARFADGTVFDSSYKRGRPLTMRLGVGKVYMMLSHILNYRYDPVLLSIISVDMKLISYINFMTNDAWAMLLCLHES